MVCPAETSVPIVRTHFTDLHSDNQDSSQNSCRTGQTEVLLQFPLKCSSRAAFQATLSSSTKSSPHPHTGHPQHSASFHDHCPQIRRAATAEATCMDRLLQFTARVTRICSLLRGPEMLSAHPAASAHTTSGPISSLSGGW